MRTKGKYILGIVILSILCGGCKKFGYEFREQYGGEWLFTIEYSYFDMLTGSYDKTYTNEGKIWYEEDDKIKIEYKNNTVLDFDIEENGEISIDSYYPISGKFSDNEHVHFSKYSGGHGGGTTERVTGVKI